jgi:B12-binding domain/radical SAM domain protein
VNDHPHPGNSRGCAHGHRRRPAAVIPVDLLLLHPPSVYDFREKSILYGPVSDMVPSSVVFELYPIGFLTIAGYLQQQGLQVRIVNLALRMLTDRAFDVAKFLAEQRPKAIGIDLHWMPHCHGAIEIARLAKAIHPDVPVILGGLSATYYHEELLQYPEIDYVLRGDSTEPPLHQLLTALQRGDAPEQIPNLSWRRNGEICVNPLTFIPTSLDYVDVRPELLIEMAIRYRDFTSVLPFNGWLRNPTTMVLPLKGCAYECVTCGSSATTCTHLTLRRKPVFRSPGNLARNVAAIGRFSRGPIVIPGDLLQGGSAYATRVIDDIAATGVRNGICFEFFDVPPIEFIRHIDAKLPSWSFEISPESHDHAVRRAMEGEIGYDNAALENFLREALKLGCDRIDVFFMIGLPKQTYGSVMETVDYCEHLFKWGDARLQCFISPMGPFLDPGSRIFEEPARFGYRVNLARLGTRGSRLSYRHLDERLAQFLQVSVGALALEHLRDEVRARLERLAHRVERKLEEVHAGRLVGGVDARDVGRDVRDDQVELGAVEPFEDLLDHDVFGEVALDEIDVGDPIHRQDVGREHAALRTDAAGRDLRPAARRGAEVHDPHAGFEQAIPLVQLDQLVGGARTIAVLLRLFDVRVVDVSLQPEAAALGAGHDALEYRQSPPLSGPPTRN